MKERYLMYLRKSRADIEAEQMGSGETLARHKQDLMLLAKRMQISIAKKDIYQEIVSGESISERPQMQALLKELETGSIAGVLAVELSRLTRGNSIEQGIVFQTFKYTNTKIITPSKTYDPNNDADATFFEFGMFMSRQEYNTTKKRLWNGRIASMREGKYVAGNPPYGYDVQKLKGEKGFILVINETEAANVRLIYDLYINSNLGYNEIVKELYRRDIDFKGKPQWTSTQVQRILHNITYTGKIRFQWKKQITKIENGQAVKKGQRCKDDYLIFDGRHDAIIDDTTYNKAQEIATKRCKAPVRSQYRLRNPFRNILFCKKCGAPISTHAQTKGMQPWLSCRNTICDCVGCDMADFEPKLLDALNQWTKGYILKQDKPIKKNLAESTRKKIPPIEKRLKQYNAQKIKCYELLEQSIYDIDTFTARKDAIDLKIQDATNEIAALKETADKQDALYNSQSEFIPKMMHIVDVYNTLPDAQTKGKLLSDVLEKIEYYKAPEYKRQKGHYEIVLYPRIPKKF